MFWLIAKLLDVPTCSKGTDHSLMASNQLNSWERQGDKKYTNTCPV